MLKVCLLAPGGMMPLPDRYLTSLIINCRGSMILIDCGEGTQIQLKKLKWGIKAIDIICITHFHADHVAGLPGLLSTIGNADRKEPLTIIGPKGLKDVVKGLTVITPILSYELKLIEIDEEIKNLKFKDYIVNAISVEHSIDCLAYSIEVRRGRKFDKAKAEKNNIPKVYWNRLQKGEKAYEGNKIFTPDMVLGEERKGIKLCYSTDLRPSEKLINFLKEADLFIGEGMYGDDSYLEKAKENKHMLFSECASLAKDAKVKELWLTHFSPLLQNPEDFLEETKKIFENTKLGEELMVKELIFEK
ncbi:MULTISPECIES: ribonuclease Z [Clostridium]|uniref:Ribonuclease Z n=2 Tax=Clostridium TaxID=1485 RepID=A0A151ARL3_9CLOT|nr:MULTISPECIES: ribonuclease Z [Clostridium]KYH30284.1 ribonuclease Z [Clostridium colicanis DSM 13634]PRR69398.1 Ribonuclease Z [Clostridium thermopalmarium DSM 5974]PVZ26336.1 ribonuclease Z [Clostridium thermopalmarium DSM 5974]